MVQVIKKDGDLLKQTTLLYIVYQIIKAQHKVLSSTILNYQRKSGLFGDVYGPEAYPKDQDKATNVIKVIAKKLQRARVIKEAINIDRFIYPEDEAIQEP